MHEYPFQTLDIQHNPLEYRKEQFHLGIAHKTPRKIDHLHRPTKVLSVAIQKFKNVLVILDAVLLFLNQMIFNYLCIKY